MDEQFRRFPRLVGSSPAMQELFQLMAKVTHSRSPVLIVGESGTGKELVARSIHECGSRASGPFIPVDCGALVPTLIESELFGHLRGAFTGATAGKQGLLQMASGGTIFFDEIGELPLHLQVKLLRSLQEKQIRPVGGTREVKVELRVIAATSRDLEAEIAAQRFREDLYYRLNVAYLRLPPLRKRRADIALLANHFLDKFHAPGRPHLTLSEEASADLMAYDWPGNVRELENTIERAVMFASGSIMQPADVSFLSRGLKTGFSARLAQEKEKVIPLREAERIAILRAITEAHGDKRLAAKMLRIGKTTLYRKLKEYRSSGQTAKFLWVDES